MVLIGLFTTLGLSTGAASLSLDSQDAVTGHTGFVAMVRDGPIDDLLERTPVDYGLATSREVWLWGAYTRETALSPERDQFAFVWREDAPDPRHDPSLLPTGEFARIQDATGQSWTVYEFRYAGFAAFEEDASARAGWADLYTYAVRIDEARYSEPDVTGTPDGRYNYVLTYRLDRMFPELTGAAAPDALQAIRAATEPVLREVPELPIDGAPTSAPGPAGNETTAAPDAPQRYAVRFATGAAPSLLHLAHPTA